MVRFQIAFSDAEAAALLDLAEAQLRDPREQARLIVRDELLRLGLLLGPDWTPDAQLEKERAHAGR